MTRASLVLFGALAACEPALHAQPLPDLVPPQPPRAVVEPMLFVPGETLVYDVHMGGFTIGRAELAVEDDRIVSRFATSNLASAVTRVHHDLTTFVEAGAPSRAIETLAIEGDAMRTETTFQRATVVVNSRPISVPGGNFGHTLHSALGVIRAWARPNARSGFVYVVHAGGVVELAFAQPLVENWRGERMLRVECRVRGEVPISISIWLRTSPDHTPVRFEVRAEGVRLTAELVAQ